MESYNNKNDILDALRSGVHLVEFHKADGTLRAMQATLNEDILPEKLEDSSKTTLNKKSEDALPVWDVDSSGWRSFRWDRLIMIDGVEVKLLESEDEQS